jgi:hypothetical protein
VRPRLSGAGRRVERQRASHPLGPGQSAPQHRPPQREMSDRRARCLTQNVRKIRDLGPGGYRTSRALNTRTASEFPRVGRHGSARASKDCLRSRTWNSSPTSRRSCSSCGTGSTTTSTWAPTTSSPRMRAFNFAGQLQATLGDAVEHTASIRETPGRDPAQRLLSKWPAVPGPQACNDVLEPSGS